MSLGFFPGSEGPPRPHNGSDRWCGRLPRARNDSGRSRLVVELESWQAHHLAQLLTLVPTVCESSPPFATVEALALCEFRECSAPRENTVTESPEAGKKTGRSLRRKQIDDRKPLHLAGNSILYLYMYDSCGKTLSFCCCSCGELTGRRQPPALAVTTTTIQTRITVVLGIEGTHLPTNHIILHSFS